MVSQQISYLSYSEILMTGKKYLLRMRLSQSHRFQNSLRRINTLWSKNLIVMPLSVFSVVSCPQSSSSRMRTTRMIILKLSKRPPRLKLARLFFRNRKFRKILVRNSLSTLVSRRKNKLSESSDSKMEISRNSHWNQRDIHKSRLKSLLMILNQTNLKPIWNPRKSLRTMASQLRPS